MSEQITLRDHVEMIRNDTTISRRAILKLYNKLSDDITTAIFNPIMTDRIRRIYLDATPRSILLDGDSIRIRRRGTVYLEYNTQNDYTYDVYTSWDAPFFERIFDSDTVENIQSWSPEMLLMRYIAEQFRKGKTKPKGTTWFADWARSSNTKKLLKCQMCILWYSLPRMSNYIENSPVYKAFEHKLVAATRLLYNMKDKQRYTICNQLLKLRAFIDALKTRVHLPMVYGRFVLCVMAACAYKKSEISEMVHNPKLAPKPLKNMLAFYWFQLLNPFD
jgi:hypothetical protein